MNLADYLLKHMFVSDFRFNGRIEGPDRFRKVGEA